VLRRPLTLLLIVCIGHVLLISSQVQSKSGLPVLEAVTFGTMARVQGAVAGVADAVRSTWSQYFALRGVERENEALRQRVMELEGQLQAERARSAGTRALEEALRLQQEAPVKMLAARVIAGDPAPGSLTVTIDRGSRDGIEPNMAVLAGAGVVGRIIGRPAAHAARVQLLIGRDAGAGAVLEGSGQGGFLTGGFGDGLFRLELVSTLVAVTPGEKVLSSGQDKLYPRGYLLGSVERVEGEGRTRVIVVRPAVDFSHIEIVNVILALPPDAEADAPAPAKPPPPRGKGGA
jgi:rod shape-determining protein MreC